MKKITATLKALQTIIKNNALSIIYILIINALIFVPSVAISTLIKSSPLANSILLIICMHFLLSVEIIGILIAISNDKDTTMSLLRIAVNLMLVVLTIILFSFFYKSKQSSYVSYYSLLTGCLIVSYFIFIILKKLSALSHKFGGDFIWKLIAAISTITTSIIAILQTIIGLYK
ncbi:hypothetical protein C0213_00370 [Latilactobacillus sakei]|nr:hypothetical protein [Latilactobacillus sakei]AUX10959.1 hypothetical protein C0213_00370 [Latilactobacillus sakei]